MLCVVATHQLSLTRLLDNSMLIRDLIENNEPTRIKLGNNDAARAWIQKVYDLYPQQFQNNHVMPMGGTGDDQQFAMFELVPSFSQRGAVEVKWFQAYPLRAGVGSRAMKELQGLAREDGIALTLFPWDKGQVSQAKLTKFYRGQGFAPTVKGGKSMAWTPEQLSVAEGKQPGKSVTDAIQKVMPIAQEIWFHGSRATGKHRRNSDTDILVVVPNHLVGDQYLAVVRTLQKLSSIFDNYDIQPTKSGTNIHRIAQEEGQLLWASQQDVDEQIVNELKINNASGIGAVPHNADVDYHGLRVTMRPSMFLRLALPLDRNDPEERKAIEYCKSQLDDPGIGAPFLTIIVPESWESDDFSLEAKVRDHDGRHRCYAILDKENDEPIEVHLFVSGMRRRHISDSMIKNLRNGILNQQGQYVSGPIFDTAQ